MKFRKGIMMSKNSYLTCKRPQPSLETERAAPAGSPCLSISVKKGVFMVTYFALDQVFNKLMQSSAPIVSKNTSKLQ